MFLFLSFFVCGDFNLSVLRYRMTLTLHISNYYFYPSTSFHHSIQFYKKHVKLYINVVLTLSSRSSKVSFHCVVVIELFVRTALNLPKGHRYQFQAMTFNSSQDFARSLHSSPTALDRVFPGRTIRRSCWDSGTYCVPYLVT